MTTRTDLIHLADTEVIHLEETASTNAFLRQQHAEAPIVAAQAEYQTNGRGQGTNTWESERGKNLLFSILVHPTTLPVDQQYILSEAVALTYKQVLDQYTDGITVKWPNDIYWNDRKISGTLIETNLAAGHIKDFIIGTGININQERFVSDAPNPVSLRQILGREVDKQTIFDKILKTFIGYYALVTEGCYDEISCRYHAALYRRSGFHAYRDASGDFQAELVKVCNDGHLVLRDSSGNERRYAFKEVMFIIR